MAYRDPFTITELTIAVKLNDMYGGDWQVNSTEPNLMSWRCSDGKDCNSYCHFERRQRFFVGGGNDYVWRCEGAGYVEDQDGRD